MNLNVTESDEGERIDLFIGKRLNLSRAKLKSLFEEGRVRLDGRKAKKGEALAKGQSVSVEIPDEGPRAPQAESLPLTILHADEARLFIDKPAGIPVHPLKPNELGTVANRLIAQFPEVAEASEDPREGGLVHRLDVETSGVLLAARNREAWTALRAEMSPGGGAQKIYLALVTGPLADEGDIELPLAQRGDYVRPALSNDEAARPAKSHFKVLKRFGSDSLVQVQIFTGVMHQVRAHLAGIGAPIVGDTKYDGRAAPELGLSSTGSPRFFLHAQRLTVDYPKRMTVEAPLPASHQAFLESLTPD